MKENKYISGLASVSFRQHSPLEILEATVAANLSCIEWGSDVHAPCNDKARLREIAEMQKEFGIVCSSYGTYFKLGATPIEELERYIDAAKILDTDILRIWCGTKCGDEYSLQEKQMLTEECRKAAEIASRVGVTLCMECHKNTLTQKPEDALALMKEVDSSHFQMYWQPFQWQTKAENVAYAKSISDFTRNIHVFHWKEDQKLSLHDGIDEWRCYLAQFSTPRTLLLEFMPDNSLSTLITEAKALRDIIGE